MFKILFFISLFFLMSCEPVKNDFNQERYRTSRFTIKPSENEEVYNFIDTTSVYILTNIYHNGNTLPMQPACLKFYKNNRIGNFDNYNFHKVESLNPKNAEMGFYKYSKNKLEIEFMSYSAQSGNFLVKEKVMIKGDTIVSSYKGKIKYEYVKFKLPANFLIFKPDW